MTRAGKCTNVGPCTMVGKTQYIEDDDADFKCQECDEELEEVDENAQANSASVTSGTGDGKKKIFLAAGILVVAGAIGAGIYMMNSEEAKEPATEQQPPVVVDPTPPVSPPDVTDVTVTTGINESESESDSEPVSHNPNQLTLGYTIWKGETKGGKPHAVNGRMEFTQRYRIDPRDDKERYAEAGEYIIGEYENGRLIQGRWYKKSGDTEVIMIGK